MEWWLSALSLKCEVIVIVWLCAYPSFVRLIFVWLSVFPLSAEVVFVGERSCVLPVVIAPNPQWRSLCGKSSVDELVKILLCEGGNVELCARTSKHILVFAIDPLSLTLSLTLCIDTYCHIIYMLVFVCVCHTCV